MYEDVYSVICVRIGKFNMMLRDLIYVILIVDELVYDILVGFDLISKINWLEEIFSYKMILFNLMNFLFLGYVNCLIM